MCGAYEEVDLCVWECDHLIGVVVRLYAFDSRRIRCLNSLFLF